MSLLIVGSTALDDIYTPTDSRKNVFGGSAFHATLGASPLTSVAVSGRVGYDFPQEHLDMLNSKNIDISMVSVSKDTKTFHWVGKYSEDFNKRDTVSLDLGSWVDYKFEKPQDSDKYKTVFIANMGPSDQIEVYEQLKNSADFFILDTMNFYIETFNDDLKKAISNVDMLLINDEEFQMLTDEKSFINGGKSLIKKYPNLKYVVIKLGSYGSALFSDKGDIFITPAYPLDNVQDPTGAGDSYGGGIAGYLDYNGDYSFESVKTSVIYGTCTASFNVSGFTIDNIKDITIEDIEKRVLEMKNMLEFNK